MQYLITAVHDLSSQVQQLLNEVEHSRHRSNTARELLELAAKMLDSSGNVDNLPVDNLMGSIGWSGTGTLKPRSSEVPYSGVVSDSEIRSTKRKSG
jgi:hypothetical protein